MQYVQAKHAEQCSNLLGTLKGHLGSSRLSAVGTFTSVYAVPHCRILSSQKSSGVATSTRNVLLPNMHVSCTH